MKTILIIEDNQDIRENTVEILELAGYLVYAAENGEEGVAKAYSIIPDLIISDIMMPVLDGWEVLKQLKANNATAGIPFIYLSASVEKKEVQAGLDMGANGYIRKPFEKEELLETIKKFIGSKLSG